MAFRSFGTARGLSLAAALISTVLSSPTRAQSTAPDAPPPEPPTTAPPASQAEEEKEGDDGPGLGLYVDVDGAAMFAFSSSHEWKDDCPAASIGTESWAPECSTSAPIGVLADAKLGFRFGYLGVELMGVFAGDWSRASFDQPIPGLDADSTMDVGRVGGGVGAGLRLMTAPGMFRISGGAGGGVLFRHVY